MADKVRAIEGTDARQRLHDESSGTFAPVVYDGARSAVAVVPADGTTFNPTRGLYVGGAGNVAVTMADGTTATFNAAAVGYVLPISVIAVKATGTTATNIVALY